MGQKNKYDLISGLVNLVVNSNINVVPKLCNYPREVIQSIYFSFQDTIWYPMFYLKVFSKTRGNATEEKDDDFMDDFEEEENEDAEVSSINEI